MGKAACRRPQGQGAAAVAGRLWENADVQGGARCKNRRTGAQEARARCHGRGETGSRAYHSEMEVAEHTRTGRSRSWQARRQRGPSWRKRERCGRGRGTRQGRNWSRGTGKGKARGGKGGQRGRRRRHPGKGSHHQHTPPYQPNQPAQRLASPAPQASKSPTWLPSTHHRPTLAATSSRNHTCRMPFSPLIPCPATTTRRPTAPPASSIITQSPLWLQTQAPEQHRQPP